MIYHSWKKYAPILVYVAVMLLAISDTGIQMLILNTAGFHSRTLRKIAFCLLFAKVLGTRYTKKEFFIIFPIAILSLYNYTICGNNYCLWNILMISSMKDIEETIFFKTLFFSSLSAMIFVGLLSALNIGGSISLIENFGRGTIETRYCFGMFHPNIWHFSFARCVVFYVFAFKEHLNWKHLLSLLILNTIAFYFSASRTGFLATTIFVLIILAYIYLPKLMHSCFIKYAIGSGIPLLFCMFYICLRYVAVSRTKLAIFINEKLTTGRLSQASDYLFYHPLKVWGTRFPDDGTVFDCGFFRMLSESGWILGSIFIIAFLLLLFMSLKYKRYEITALCIFFSIYSLYETYPTTRPSYNIVIFFMALLIYKNKYFSSETSYIEKSKSSSF